ncbi:hypothetical protein [Vibrio parahaemolyticus]|uniref:Uncharacterized protein n=1 Tax=Vibrio parahaemolyticus TaxID=670 RepID=A0A9Q3YJP6_VIBPH|nr:hypothetical protein [Vibrio parahaemolyticus]MCC3807656.1 hypothetical protein [Vibrio parahaemolyticus]QQD06615.1 hypothetical protein JCT85_23910 [Vibrio parahaemolyticus]
MTRSVFKTQSDLTSNLYQKRWILSVELAYWTLFSLILIHPDIPLLVSIAVLCGIPIGYYVFAFQAKNSPTAKLAVVPHWRKKDTVAIHLQHPSDAFNTETYRELPILLQDLANMNIRTVTLTSPMFGKNGQLRSLTRLKRSVSSVTTDISSSSFSIFKTPLAGIVLGVTKYMKKAPALKHTDLTTQYQLTLTLREQI